MHGTLFTDTQRANPLLVSPKHILTYINIFYAWHPFSNTKWLFLNAPNKVLCIRHKVLTQSQTFAISKHYLKHELIGQQMCNLAKYLSG